jgi:hypothetical protein
MGGKSKNTTVIRVPNSVYRVLKADADRDGLTIAQVLARLIPSLPWEGPPLPRGWGMKWQQRKELLEKPREG